MSNTNDPFKNPNKLLTITHVFNKTGNDYILDDSKYKVDITGDNNNSDNFSEIIDYTNTNFKKCENNDMREYDCSKNKVIDELNNNNMIKNNEK